MFRRTKQRRWLASRDRNYRSLRFEALEDRRLLDSTGPFGRGDNVPIPDNNTPVNYSINSPAPVGSVVDSVSFSFRIVHDFVPDITVDIISPDGTQTRHWNRNGSEFDVVILVSEFNVSTWSGENARGPWRLVVTDTAALDSGYIDYFNMTIEYTIPRPDLSNVAIAFLNPDPVDAGQQISGQVVVRNTGQSTAGGFQVAFDLVNYFTRQTVTRLSPNVTLSGIAPNQSAFQNFGVTIPSSIGRDLYFLRAVADVNGSIAELSESNNTGESVSFRVERPVDFTANAGPDTSAAEGATVSLNGSVIGPGSDSDYAFSWLISSDNGQPSITQNTRSASFQPGDNGTYTAILTVTRIADNRSDQDQALITVINVAPSITGVSVANAAFEGELVAVTITAFDPAGANDPLTYEFDFDNDGTFEVSGPSGTAQHVYPDNGVYTVRVRVRDDDLGVSAEETRQVSVLENLPPIVDLGPDRDFSLGDNASLVAIFSDPGTGDQHTFSWQVMSSNGQTVPSGDQAEFSFLPLQTGAYTVSLTVTDDEDAFDADEIVVTVNMDMAPLRFEGEFSLDTITGFREATGVIFVGHMPIGGNPFTPVARIDGDVRISGGLINSVGVVSATSPAGTPLLFDGTFSIPVGMTQSTVQETQPTNAYKLAGLDVEFTGIDIRSDRLALNTTLLLPAALGGIALPFGPDRWLTFGQNQVRLEGGDARVEFPDIPILLRNSLDLQATDLVIEYAGATNELKLQGGVRVPAVYNFIADFSGGNYISVIDGQIDMKGRLSIEDINWLGGRWGLKQLYAEFDTVTGILEGGATLKIPTGIEITADVLFELIGGRWLVDRVSVDVDGINRPIGTTGAFLQAIAGTIDNLAQSDPFSVSELNFTGQIGISAGPALPFDVPLPDWLGGPIEEGTALARLDVIGTIDNRHVEGAATTRILESLLTGSTIVGLNWDERLLYASGPLSVAGGLITMNTSFTTDSNYNLTLLGSGSVNLPDIGGLLRGQSIASGSGYFQYHNNDVPTDDYFLAYGQVNVPILGNTVLGVKVDFTGDVDTIFNMTEINRLAPPGGVATLIEESAGWQVTDDSGKVLFLAEWDNEIGLAPETLFELVSPGPSSTVYTLDNLGSHTDVGIVDILTSPTSIAIAVDRPEFGAWTLRVRYDEEVDPGEIRFAAYKPSAAPSIELLSVMVDESGNTGTVRYAADDPDSDARISFFYNNGVNDLNGVLIAEGIVESDGEQTYQFDTSNWPVGLNHVYAIIDDGQNAFATDAVEIGFGHITGNVWKDENGDGHHVSDSGLSDWTVFVDSNHNGILDADEMASTTGANGDYAFHGLQEGTYTVRLVKPTGWTLTFPAMDEYTLVVSRSGESQFESVDFSVFPPMLTGSVFHDRDADGVNEIISDGGLLRTLIPSFETQRYYGTSVATDGERLAVGAHGWNVVDVYDASGETLLQRIGVPSPQTGNFGNSVDIAGDRLLVGAPARHRLDNQFVGEAYVYDLTDPSGNPLFTLNSPAPFSDGLMGNSVAIAGGDFLVGATLDDQDGTRSGRAYFFSGETGELLHTFVNPNANPANDEFGGHVAAIGNYVFISAPNADINGMDNVGAVYLYHLGDRAVAGDEELLRTFAHPSPQFGTGFGVQVASLGSTHVAISAYAENVGAAENAGAVYMFDVATGDFVSRIENPFPQTGDLFGYDLAAVGNDKLLISAWGDSEVATGAGAAYLFDAFTGELLQIVRDPEPAEEDHFGGAVAAAGQTFIVGASADGPNDYGGAFVFQRTTDTPAAGRQVEAIPVGGLLHTLSPTTETQQYYGNAISVFGDRFAVSGYGQVAEQVDVYANSGASLITSVSGPSGVNFGSQIALGDNALAVSAPVAGHVYVTNADTPSAVARIIDPNAEPFQILQAEEMQFDPGVSIQNNSALFQTVASIRQSFSVNEAGSYRILVNAIGIEGGPNLPSVRVRIDGNELSTLDIPQVWQDYNFGGVTLSTGDHEIEITLLNDFYEPGVGDLNLFVDEVVIQRLASEYGFGSGLSFLDPAVLLVGNPYDSELAFRAGQAYLFNGMTGQLLHTFINPGDTPANDQFGQTVASVGDRVLIGAWNADVGGVEAGAVYLFDMGDPEAPGDDQLLRRFQHPSPDANDAFGFTFTPMGEDYVAIAAVNDDLVAENAGAVYLFEVATGALVRTIANPFPGLQDQFGISLAAVGSDKLLVGTWGDNEKASAAGAAYLIDAFTGELLQILYDPNPAENDRFGSAVAATGQTLIVGSAADGPNDHGGAFVFDMNLPYAATTDASGHYAIGQVAAGEYLVRTAENDAWTSTTNAIQNVSLFPGSPIADVDFGEFQVIALEEEIATGFQNDRVAIGVVRRAPSPVQVEDVTWSIQQEGQSAPSLVDASTDLQFTASSDGNGVSFAVAKFPLLELFPGKYQLSLSAVESRSQEIASGVGGGPIHEDDDQFGRAVASLGDFNGDGVTDLAVGAPGDDTGGFDRGALYVLFMNANGMVASSQKIANGIGGFPTLVDRDGNLFGSAVTSLGDVDGDGITELAVGAPGDRAGPGVPGGVFVLFMNADGTVKNSQEIAVGIGGGVPILHEDRFGMSVAALGDLDGDGVPDLVVGADGDDSGGVDSGAVHVLFLNADGTVKSTQKIASGVGGGPVFVDGDGYLFGASVASLGDLDGDGVTDMVVGAPGDRQGPGVPGGMFVLFMNANGTVKSSQEIAVGVGGGVPIVHLDRFGVSVASLGDLDGDGVTEIAVGADGDDTGGTDSGAVHVLFMNANGTVKSTQKIASGVGGGPKLADGDYFGSAVASLGDLDGDGVLELAVGADGDDIGSTNRGAVHVLFMNANGTVLSSSYQVSTSLLVHSGLPGDYDSGGVVDDQDYTVWKAAFGTTVSTAGLGADGNANGIVDAADYTVWRDHLGATVYQPPTLPGDYDRNGAVESTDYDLWKSTFGQSVPVWDAADGTGNGVIDAADYTVWRDHLGVTANQPPTLPGDYDRNGIVAPADYDMWKSTFGQSGNIWAGADGNGNGIIDAADYTAWRDHFGASIAAALIIAAEVGPSQTALSLGASPFQQVLQPSSNSDTAASATYGNASDSVAGTGPTTNPVIGTSLQIGFQESTISRRGFDRAQAARWFAFEDIGHSIQQYSRAGGKKRTNMHLLEGGQQVRDRLFLASAIERWRRRHEDTEEPNDARPMRSEAASEMAFEDLDVAETSFWIQCLTQPV